MTPEEMGQKTLTNVNFPTCTHCYCGGGWSTMGSTTSGDPDGTLSWATCCKCGKGTEPVETWGR